MKKAAREVNVSQVKVADGFWTGMQEKVIDVVSPFQEKVLNDEVPGVAKSHAIENFRIAAGLSEGEFYGMVFQDSDVAKWLEGVAYSLSVKPDADLEARADGIIDIIEKAQQPDGYLHHQGAGAPLAEPPRVPRALLRGTYDGGGCGLF